MYKSEILAKTRGVPTNPADTLYSRRRHEVDVFGDVFVFPLRESTATPEFVHLIKTAQETLYKIIETDLHITGKIWDSKAQRHAEKQYKRHKELHLSFSCSLPPSLFEEYERIKRQQNMEITRQISEAIYALLNQGVPITGRFKECKINPDGHIVIRVTMEPVEKLMVCKNALKKIFKLDEDRHTEPEKQATLASVICVVDMNQLSMPAQHQLSAIISELNLKLQTIHPIEFNTVEWIEYDKRTLSPNSRLAVREMTTQSLPNNQMVFSQSSVKWLELFDEYNTDIREERELSRVLWPF